MVQYLFMVRDFHIVKKQCFLNGQGEVLLTVKKALTRKKTCAIVQSKSKDVYSRLESAVCIQRNRTQVHLVLHTRKWTAGI